jgi:secreted trypsin-like serine protease
LNDRESLKYQDALGTVAGALTNALPQTSDRAVVAIVVDGRVVCSGTLIAPRFVLTAAHCLSTPPDSVVFGADASSGKKLATRRTITHPQFEIKNLAHDVGLIELEADAGEPTASRATNPIDGAIVGTSVGVLGFGRPDASGTSGQKREGTSRVTALTPSMLELDPAPSLPCNGDSGGPVVVKSGDVETVIGVTSYGDEACSAKAFATRVDAERAFLDDALAPPPPRDDSACSLSRGRRDASDGLLVVLALALCALRKR